jgi:hypothetical protein
MIPNILTVYVYAYIIEMTQVEMKLLPYLTKIYINDTMQYNTNFKLINIDVDFKSSNNFLPQVDQHLFGSLNASFHNIFPSF